MSKSINKVILIGNLGKDPEIKNSTSANIANFSLATTESWKDKGSGEWQSKTEWHNIVVFNERLVEYTANNLFKGSKVYLEGQLQTRKWTDKNGQDRYTTEIVLTKNNGTLINISGKEEISNIGKSSSNKMCQDDVIKNNINRYKNDEIPF